MESETPSSIPSTAEIDKGANWMVRNWKKKNWFRVIVYSIFVLISLSGGIAGLLKLLKPKEDTAALHQETRGDNSPIVNGQDNSVYYGDAYDKESQELG